MCPKSLPHVKLFLSKSLCWFTVQGLFVPLAHVGSGDPVRVLRLYTMNTLDTLWSIYCWDICTTCCYQIYVLLYWLLRSRRSLLTDCLSRGNDSVCLSITLYCAVLYIAACVDISRMVFRDCSVLHLPGEALILVAKLSNSSNGYTSNFACWPALLSVGKLGSTENDGGN